LAKKLRIFFLTSIIFIAVTMPFRELFRVMEVTEMRPASAFPPVFGLMLGLPGAFGCAVGNLIADIISGYGFAVCALGFVAQFVYGVLPILLWKAVNKNGGFLRLNNVKNVLRYIGIVALDSLVMAGLLGFIMQIAKIGSLFSTATLMILYNNFVFCMLLGIPIVIFLSTRKNKNGVTLNERFILIFLGLGVISASLIGFFAYSELSRIIAEPLEMWNRIYFYIAADLFVFYFFTVVFLWYAEKNITIPVESLSEIAKSYVSQESKNGAVIAKKCEELCKNQSETGVLAEAFRSMVLDIDSYIDNLTKVTAEKERIGAELDVAKKIQASMLPSIFPPFPDRREFDLYATMQPAKEVGGDFYDFFLLDKNTLAVVVADVSGKGVPAALFMVIAKTLIKNNAQLGKSPKEVFETVNNILCENNDAGMFVTAFMGYLHIPSGKFTFVNAGHNFPLIKKQNKYEFLKTKPEFILAGMENMIYSENEITLEKGDTLFLYTDGVTEAMNRENKLFSDVKLLETVDKYKDSSPIKLLPLIKNEIDRFADGAEQADDITMLALRYKGGEDTV